ncbi:MAG: hypothetical protein ABEI99_02305 [Halobaculum sp.]
MAKETKIVADTSTLEAVCKTEYAAPVFEHLPLSTTDTCFEEIKRTSASASDPQRAAAARQVLDNYRDYGTPRVVPTSVSYEPYVSDQGEQSIVTLLSSDSDRQIKYVLLFDFEAAEEIRSLVDLDTVEVSTPGRAFELCWQGGFLTEANHHDALRQLAASEGWRGEALVEQLPKTRYQDVF